MHAPRWARCATICSSSQHGSTSRCEWAGAGGRLHFAWRSTLGYDTQNTRKRVGARTGRLSSSPNAQNLTASLPEVGFDEQAELRLPDALHGACGALPNLREYLVAEEVAELG